MIWSFDFLNPILLIRKIEQYYFCLYKYKIKNYQFTLYYQYKIYIVD